ncbi:hypothetical protein MKZ38_002688 [Zalerion maritima]|uniref:Geranylgeranyl pyrophosphate synthetase n=1 Tax=Zalerion maritima TaxID=339359 RepID=A0AAD5RPX0_9PEZI|nr:hypothetical protein MKZ38_002688 [Zalerion maritima]
MASTTIVQITRFDLEKLQAPTAASITDVKELASYNWIKAVTPTIAVPGSPALWSPPRGPCKVKKDSGLIYIAQNAARHPDSPLEPLFRALYIADPSFDIRAVDVLTDRNNIRKLLSFVDGATSGKPLEAFTIEIEMAKNTAIFCCSETKMHEYIGPGEFRGFGHEFEKAFGGLKFIVRHETDGYTVEDAALSKALASMTLSPRDETFFVKPPGSKMNIKRQGQLVPRDSTLEIKTRASHRPLVISEVASQIWVSQTPKIVRAYHTKGLFTEPRVEDVTAEIKAWESRNQRNLKKLAALIKEIRNVVQDCGGKAVVRYNPFGAKLVVKKVEDGKKALPEDLYAKWEEDEGDSQSTSEQNTGK